MPDEFEVLVPGCSGQRFGADAPAGRRIFDYPFTWEAPFILIQGRRGGVIVWAVNEGYVKHAPEGERDPLMDALARSFLGR